MSDDTIKLILINEKLDLIFQAICLTAGLEPVPTKILEQYFKLETAFIRASRNE